MANVQIQIGGPPVNVPMTTSGNGPGGTFTNSGLQVVSGTGTTIAPATAYPASGNSITVGNLVFTNTGQTDTFSGNAFPRFSVQALAGAGAGVGNALEEGQGTNLNTYALFDVVAAAAPLTTPTGVTATAGPNLAVTFNDTNTGTQPSGTTYNLLRATSAGGEGATPVASGITVLPYTFTESAPGTYYYKLTASAGGTTSAASAEVSTTAYNSASQPSNTASGTPSVPAPGAVTGLVLVLADTGTTPNPTLTWALPVGGQAVTGINIRRGTAAGGENATPINGGTPLSATATSFVDTTATYNTSYYYVVDTLDSSGATSSAEVHIKTDTSAPTNLTVTPGNNVNTLNWTNAAGTLATLIEASANGTTGWAALVIVGAGLATYADTSAVNGVQKFYRARDLD